ncbi:MAG: polysaccharide pyruvyl transferase family protein [Ruminococcus sp.]|nr:polysaccharide pyruvyl transferase family protein [Ruminococcus sp.]MBQ8296934.1 polysaccharide pyruvyl transferase family protein [Ruminococcus sp.]
MKNKKAGILTFHESRNYGAVLQGYALQQKMSEIFGEMDIIDYQNPEIEKVVKLWSMKGKGPKAFMRAVPGFAFRYRKKMAFDSYMNKYMSRSAKADRQNIAKVCAKYDVLITGSDQVWNTQITGNDKTYFLDFANPNQKRVAYAASFGDKKMELDDSYAKLLKKFDLITLRESIMLDEVKEASGKDVHLCCDPTLLISPEQWREHASKRLTDKKYVFLFVIDECPELTAYAHKVAKEKNLTLISNKNDMSFLKNPRPNDFLSWVLNAEYVVTNSFHGTVFSLLFRKKFVSHTFTASGTPKKRIAELLKTVGLEHRNTRNTSLDIDCAENWENVSSELDKIKDSSWNIIRKWFEE